MSYLTLIFNTVLSTVLGFRVKISWNNICFLKGKLKYILYSLLRNKWYFF